MSIAELIMQGTQRSSESTAWVGDSLAKLGQNVGQALAQREQQKQAQEMLPFLKQNLQAAMTDAQNGKPGQAYSKLLGSLDTQTLNNPQLAGFVKLGFDAINQTTDAKRTGGTSLVDFLIAKQFGLPLPTGGDGTGGDGTGGGVGGNQIDATTPVQEMDNQAFGATLNPLVDGDLPAWTRPTNPAEPMVSTRPPSATTESVKPPSQTQAVYAQRQTDINKAVESGVPFSSIMAESTKMIWDKDSIKPFAKGFKSIAGIDRYIPGAEGVAILDSPDQLKQKGMNISSKGGVSLSFENIDPLYDYQAAKEPFNKNVSDAVAILNADKGLQKAIEKLGGFENISFSTRMGKNYIEYQENGKNKSIEVKDATRKATEFMLGVAQGAKDAMMPLYGTEIDIPAVGGGGGGQTSVSQKVLNATAQAKRELPGASNDKILERARAIAAAAK